MQSKWVWFSLKDQADKNKLKFKLFKTFYNIKPRIY